MISDNQMISGCQASWIFMLDMLAAGFFSLTAAKEQASSLTMLVGSLLTIGLVLIYYKASFCMFDQYEKKTGIRLSEQKLPGILCLLWLIFYLAGLIWALRFYCAVIADRIPVAYGRVLPIIFLMAALIYGAGKGMEVRGRMSELMGWLICLPLILLFIFGLQQVIQSGCWRYLMVENVKQEGGISLLLMLKNGLAGAAFFLLSDQPLLLWRCIQRQNRRKGIYPVAFAGAGLMLLFSTGLTVCLLSPEGIAGERYPFGVVLQLIRFPGNFISRYDIFFVMLWMMSFFVFAGGMLIHLTVAAKGLIRTDNKDAKMDRKLALLFGILITAGLLCGCYAEREPQNRNYIMCMGIDSDPEGGLKISYGFPDLSALTGTDAGEAEPMRVIAAASVSEASELLNASSDKTTDYSQMPVILMGKDLFEDQEKRSQVMNELADEKTIRRTALIARAEHTAEDILQLDDDVHGSVGVFIYELCQNNYENKGCTMSILENFIGGRAGDETVIPVFENNSGVPEIIELISYK